MYSFWFRRCHGYQYTFNVRGVYPQILTWVIFYEKRACFIDAYVVDVSHSKWMGNIFEGVHMRQVSQQQQYCQHTFISSSLDFVPICQFVAPAESNIAHLRCLKKVSPCVISIWLPTWLNSHYNGYLPNGISHIPEADFTSYLIKLMASVNLCHRYIHYFLLPVCKCLISTPLK